jgi:hypothetical protein
VLTAPTALTYTRARKENSQRIVVVVAVECSVYRARSLHKDALSKETCAVRMRRSSSVEHVIRHLGLQTSTSHEEHQSLSIGLPLLRGKQPYQQHALPSLLVHANYLSPLGCHRETSHLLLRPSRISRSRYASHGTASQKTVRGCHAGTGALDIPRYALALMAVERNADYCCAVPTGPRVIPKGFDDPE